MTRALALSLALASCAGWRPANYATEASFVALIAVDWGQTRKITRECAETNPILGKCGQRFPVDAWMPLVIGIHLVTSMLLTPRLRDWWQGITGGAEGAGVWINLRGGYGP